MIPYETDAFSIFVLHGMWIAIIRPLIQNKKKGGCLVLEVLRNTPFPE